MQSRNLRDPYYPPSPLEHLARKERGMVPTKSGSEKLEWIIGLFILIIAGAAIITIIFQAFPYP